MYIIMIVIIITIIMMSSFCVLFHSLEHVAHYGKSKTRYSRATNSKQHLFSKSPKNARRTHTLNEKSTTATINTHIHTRARARVRTHIHTHTHTRRGSGRLYAYVILSAALSVKWEH